MISAPLPVAVIGAGPVGLAAAAHLLERGLATLVLESAEAPGAHVREWGHVRMFSPWKDNLDAAATRLLERNGWTAPEESEHPTGAELVKAYLEPLAATPELSRVIAYGRRVSAVGKSGFDRLRSRGRERVPFHLLFEHRGEEGRVSTRAVTDASGTWATPSPLGAGGLRALGESGAQEGDRDQQQARRRRRSDDGATSAQDRQPGRRARIDRGRASSPPAACRRR